MINPAWAWLPTVVFKLSLEGSPGVPRAFGTRGWGEWSASKSACTRGAGYWPSFLVPLRVPWRSGLQRSAGMKEARAWERHSSCGTRQAAWQPNVQHHTLTQTNSSRGILVFLGMDTAHWGSHTSREQDLKGWDTDGSGSRSPHGVMKRFLYCGACRKIAKMQNPSPLPRDSGSGALQDPGVSPVALLGKSRSSGQSPSCGLKVPWL